MSTALVLGGAGCVWADVEAALELGEFDGVVTCNDITAAWPGRIDAAVSLHSDSWPRWIIARDRAGYARPERVLGHLEFTDRERRKDVVTGYAEYRFPGQTRTGSSGLFALKVALVDLGFDRAVLCGVPMSAEHGHFFEPTAWRAAQAHQTGWREALPQFQDRARSMSGWTRKLLGPPTADWLSA